MGLLSTSLDQPTRQNDAFGAGQSTPIGNPYMQDYWDNYAQREYNFQNPQQSYTRYDFQTPVQAPGLTSALADNADVYGPRPQGDGGPDNFGGGSDGFNSENSSSFDGPVLGGLLSDAYDYAEGRIAMAPTQAHAGVLSLANDAANLPGYLSGQLAMLPTKVEAGILGTAADLAETLSDPLGALSDITGPDVGRTLTNFGVGMLGPFGMAHTISGLLGGPTFGGLVFGEDEDDPGKVGRDDMANPAYGDAEETFGHAPTHDFATQYLTPAEQAAAAASPMGMFDKAGFGGVDANGFGHFANLSSMLKAAKKSLNTGYYGDPTDQAAQDAAVAQAMAEAVAAGQAQAASVNTSMGGADATDNTGVGSPDDASVNSGFGG